MSPLRALLSLVSYLCLGLGFFFSLKHAGLWPDTGLSPTPALFVIIAVRAALSFALVWFTSVRKGWGSWAALGWHAQALGRNVGLGLAGGLLLVGAVVLVPLFAGATVDNLLQAFAQPSFAQRLVYLGIGLNAGFLEESLFRGNLQGALTPRLGRWALVAIAALFAVYHLNFNPLGLLSKFVIGVVLGLLRVRGGSLVAPAVAHAMVWVVAGEM